MNESLDTSDATQVTIFIQAINDNFQVIEKLLGLESMNGTAKGTDFLAILKSCESGTPYRLKSE